MFGLYCSTFWENVRSKNWMKGPRQNAQIKVPRPTRPPSSQHSRALSASVKMRHPKYGQGVVPQTEGKVIVGRDAEVGGLVERSAQRRDQHRRP